ncbi:hypothetical protein GCM10010124_12630 [Pilimelia terevasa]|uniref:Uncharacterized protein n=1 Tax=Pilimelia terevasa TaxID=53372 RepID=A0A8J3FHK4_9ACTN|nr:hypothetical protein [Pilimelia terevasa]GGK21593.1 hypothetical protein GCM10010124_12630 [Pilimelia terevasa]
MSVFGGPRRPRPAGAGLPGDEPWVAGAVAVALAERAARWRGPLPVEAVVGAGRRRVRRRRLLRGGVLLLCAAAAAALCLTTR